MVISEFGLRHSDFFRTSEFGVRISAMHDPVPNAELLRSLGRLVRGLSALFWGLPIALVVCVQTAKGELLRPLGVAPPLVATALLLHGLGLLDGGQLLRGGAC